MASAASSGKYLILLKAQKTQSKAGTIAPPRRRTLATAFVHCSTIIGLPLVTLALYWQTLNAPFVFDDRTSVTQNWAIQLFGPWEAMRVSTRPLTNLSYALTYKVSGLSPWTYHLGNVLLHALSGLLVYALVRLILQQPRLARHYHDSHWAALAVSLLFVVHPLQTEVAAYISSRPDALAGFFVLAAMTCLGLALRFGPGVWGAGARCAAALCVVCGELSKESAAVAPLLLLLFEWAAAGGRPGRVLRAHWLFYGLLASGWIVPAVVIAWHPEYARNAGFGLATVSPGQYLYTQCGVILHYIRLTLIPYGQVLDYDWPLATSLTDANVWLPGGALLAGLAAAVWGWQRRPLYSLCAFWFFINLAPTSSIMPILDVAAERRMYLPILGVIGLLALLLADAWWLLKAARRPQWVIAAGTAALVVLAIAGCALLTARRNLLWRDPGLLWEDSLRSAPSNPRVHANLGTLYARRGQPERARQELEEAARLLAAGHMRHDVRFFTAFTYTHLASVYLTLHDIPRARSAYLQALAIGAWKEEFLRPRLQRVYTALGPDVPPPG